MAFNANDFRKTLTYRQTAPVPQLQAELIQALNLYRRVEYQYNLYTVGLIVFIAAPVLALFSIHWLGDLSWVLILAFSLLAMVTGSLRHRARQFQFPRDRQRLFSRLLELVERDLDGDAPLDVELYLGDRTFGDRSHQSKTVQQRPHPDRPGWQLEERRLPWFTIKGRFSDNSLFSLKFVERLAIASPTVPDSPAANAPWPQTPQASPQCRCSGFDLNLQLHVSPERYGSLTPLQPHLAEAVRLLPGATLRRYYSSDQDLSLTVMLPEAFTASAIYQTTVMLMLSAYHILNLAAQLPRRVLAPTEPLSGLEAWING
ncbi:MAG: hypothetical protein HC824_06165 [Synechococcales cyanobacterium RM1_1_8]|nr:hypothetical protein [Synechococcales cyanobacterium RM1_1_8]